MQPLSAVDIAGLRVRQKLVDRGMIGPEAAVQAGLLVNDGSEPSGRRAITDEELADVLALTVEVAA